MYVKVPSQKVTSEQHVILGSFPLFVCGKKRSPWRASKDPRVGHRQSILPKLTPAPTSYVMIFLSCPNNKKALTA